MTSSPAAVFRSIAQARRSSRRFQTNKPIDKSILKDILQTTLRGSPSSFNLQPTHILMVQAPALKEEISNHCMLGPGNQYRTRDASAIAVFLADLQLKDRIARIERLERAAAMRDANYLNVMPVASAFLTGEGRAATLLKQLATTALSTQQPMPSIEPVQAWSYKNASLVAQTYVLAATSHQLATCMMEGFDARRLKQILRIPDRYDVPMVVATGYEYDEEFKETPRLGLEEVVFGESFGEPMDFEEDEELSVRCE
jgi:putative NAD(P)H nitroreductase